MNADPFLLLATGLLLVGGCCAILRRNTQQLLLGLALVVISAVAILLQLFATRIPSSVWFGLPLCVLVVVGIRLLRQSVAHHTPQRQYPETGSQNH